MTKIELVKAVAEKTGIDQATALAAVEGFIDTLKESLIEKENVYIRGWGTWTLKHRAKKSHHYEETYCNCHTHTLYILHLPSKCN